MKTQEQKEKDAQAYIAKSAQHLFVVNEKFITKVIPFMEDDKEYFAKLIVSNDKVTLQTFEASKYYKWEMKDILFPKYVKTKSIPYFKKMKELVEIVELGINSKDNKALIEIIKEKIKEFELIKQ
jgi:hypothetical protein